MTDEHKPVDFAQTVDAAIRAAIRRIHTAAPGVVEEYAAADRRATVRPVCRGRIEGEAEARKYPAVTDVPVLFPGGGGFSLSWPLSAGDMGLIVFAERSIDEWLYSGGDDVTPTSRRAYDLTDAVFVPGLQSFADASPTIDEMCMTGAQGARVGIDDQDRLDLRALATGGGVLYPVAPTITNLGLILRDLVEVLGTGGLARIGMPPGPIVELVGGTPLPITPILQEILVALQSMEVP